MSCSIGCWPACTGARPSCCACCERPEIPLHTNGSENDIRACVTKRKVSGGTMSEDGRTARDVLLGLMKTCRKLGVSFFRYLGDRLRVPTAPCPSRRYRTSSVRPPPQPDQPTAPGNLPRLLLELYNLLTLLQPGIFRTQKEVARATAATLLKPL